MHLPFVSYMEPKINGSACRNRRFTALSEALHVLYTMRREQTQVFAIWKEPLFHQSGMLKRNVSKHNRADQLTCMSRIESPLRCNQSLYLYVPYAGLLQSWQAGSQKGRGQGPSRDIDVRTKTKQPSDVKLSQLLFFLLLFLSQRDWIILDSWPDQTLPCLCRTWDRVYTTWWNRIRVGPCGKEWHRIADKVIWYSGIGEECGW